MSNTKKHLTNIGLLILVFLIYLIVARFVMKVDPAGGTTFLMIIIGWLVFLVLLIKMLIGLFKSPKIKTISTSVMLKEPNEQEVQEEKKISIGRRMLIYLVFATFIGLLIIAHNRTVYYMNRLTISNAFDWWFWGLAIISFLVGLGGIRKGRSFYGTTQRGEHISGFTDEGPVEGTNGGRGAISLTVACISAYMGCIVHSHWILKKPFPNHTLASLVASIIGFIVVVPLFLLFLKLFRANSKVYWILGGLWLLILTVVAYL